MLKEDITNLADQLKHYQFDAILAIGRGGYIPAVYLSHALDVKGIYTCQLELYKDKVRDETGFLIRHFARIIDISRKRILIVDELIDSGVTMNKVISFVKNHVKSYTIAVLINKFDKITNNVVSARKVTDWIQFPWELI